MTFDYTNILTPGVTLQSVSFILDVQTNPQLIISGMELVGQSNILSFIVSGGMGGISYNLSAVAKLSNSVVRTDLVMVEVTGDSDMGCCTPSGTAQGLMPIPAGYQQASMSQNGVYATGLIRYFISNVEPLGAEYHGSVV